MTPRALLRVGPPHSRGQAATDYLLACALVALAFGLGAGKPLTQLLDAIGQRYQRFTWSMAQP